MIINVNDRLALSTVCALFPVTLLGPALGLIALGGGRVFFLCDIGPLIIYDRSE
jgi:hypothetical protein